MLGAIAGDIIGSPYESHHTKLDDFELFCPQSRFTDDTVMTVAIANAVISGKGYEEMMREYGKRYPNWGYGPNFNLWLGDPEKRQGISAGNGAAMRVSSIGYAFNSLREVLDEARKSSIPSHNHPDAVIGTQAVASSIFLARIGAGKDQIRNFVSDRFGYKLDETIESIKLWYRADCSCKGSVPQAIIAFLESTGFEDAIRKAVSLGGDSDTQACIAGGIAEAFYGGVPDGIRNEIRKKLNSDLLKTVDEFYVAYITPR